MPVRKVKGGWQWGEYGKVYPTKARAERQARAAYAHGYRGEGQKRLTDRRGHGTRRLMEHGH